MCRQSALGPLSIYDEARQEAQRFKWFESERAGFDVGDGALREWSARFWEPFSRYCRLMHVLGHRCYQEYECDEFGILNGFDDDVSREIVRLFCIGGENLHIICQALVHGWDVEHVRGVLVSLDINGSRLSPLVV